MSDKRPDFKPDKATPYVPEERTQHADPPAEQVSQINVTTQQPSIDKRTDPPVLEPPKATGIHDPGVSRFSTEVCPQPTGRRTAFRRNESTYAPNFYMFDAIIAESNRVLNGQYYYKRELENVLHERQVKLYYFIIAWYRIIKGMEQAGLASTSQIEFVHMLERNYQMKNLTIDGILVDAFLSLNPSEPQNKRFPLVLPSVPNINEDVYDLNYMRWSPEYIGLFPNMPMIFRSIHRLTTGHGIDNNHQAYGKADWNLTTEDVHAANGAALLQVPFGDADLTRYLRITPGFAHNSINVTTQAFANLYQNVYPHGPYQVRHEIDFFGFTNRHTWFGELIRLMSIRNGYINGTQILDKLMVNNTGEAKIELAYVLFDNPIADLYDQKVREDEELNKLVESDNDYPEMEVVSPEKTRAQTSKKGKKRHATGSSNSGPKSKKQKTELPGHQYDPDDMAEAVGDVILRRPHPPKIPVVALVREEDVPNVVIQDMLSSQWNLPSMNWLIPGTHIGDTHHYGPFWNNMILEETSDFNVENRITSVITANFIRQRSANDKL